jgi:hypothetical protein
MTALAKLIDGVATAFCSHEWSRRHEPDRLFLECIKCGSTTSGIEVGPRVAARARTTRVLAPRASVLAFWKTAA